MPTKPDVDVEMTSDEQLSRWVAGESVHQGTRPDGQCCPDFSCCNLKMHTSRAEREAFRDHPEARDTMLMTFLGQALATLTPKKEVYIAGDPTNYEEPS